MPQPHHSLRVAFCGMACQMSAVVLESLLAAGFEVCAVFVGVAGAVPGPPIAPLLPTRGPALVPLASPFAERSTAQIAAEHGVPAFALRQPSAPEAIALLGQMRPDVACVACFPRRIPAPLLAVPPLGFLNVHPSLLPAHRGPEPLFWTFRGGESRAGATVHVMDERLDAGDIAAQAPLDLPDGVSGAAAERMCAALGGRLLAEALTALAAGTLARRPQPAGGSYEPAPAAEDFRLNVGWPARRAFNFMRGSAEWGQPYPVAAGGEELVLVEAIGFDEGGVLGAACARQGDEVRVQFAPGVLYARCIRL
jgi:methionyl-tRNA formyltransferase